VVLDNPLPTALPEGSSPEERVMFEKWLKDNRKIGSIILASMTIEIQKQYDRLDDVPSLILRMKEVYAVPDRHIRYAATKAFFGTKMAEGSSVQSHGVKMLSLVEKLEDLKAGLDNDTHIDVILQSLPPSYDLFIINYNMNGRGFNLQGERQEGRTLEENGKKKAIAATASAEGSPTAPKGKGKGKVGGSQRSKANDVCMHCERKGHWKRECPQLLSNPGMFVIEVNMIANAASWVLDTGYGAHICNNLQVLKRSRRLSKDGMILRLGDGKAVAAEAVGSLSLVISDHIRIELKDRYYVPNNHENAQLWHARLGHISKDRIMRYKSEAFGRFKEYKLEVESQTGCKIKALQLDRGGKYLSVVERRNRTLLDMVRSMISFTELPPSLWDYALETAIKLLNMASSKTVAQTPYEIWHRKPASYKYLRVCGSLAYVKRLVGDKLDSRSSLCSFLEKGFPANNRLDEVLLEKSSEAPQQNATSFEPSVPTDGVPVLRRSIRESQPPESLELTGRLQPSRLGSWQKGYTQQPGVDFEETYSPVAMAKSIRILLAIAAWYDYEIWQMDMKTTFLNGFFEKEIFMDQSEGFTFVGEEQKVCRLQRSIYGLKQAFQSWNTCFDKVIRGYDFIKNEHDPCVYKKISGAWFRTLCFMSLTSCLLGMTSRC
ncbi:UNVERIFIED_CONTAM: hypothetical protein Slati_4227300, partial [Sesamum latifolium]